MANEIQLQCHATLSGIAQVAGTVIPGSQQVIDAGAASAAFPAETRFVRIISTAAIQYELGNGGSTPAATGKSTGLPANTVEFIEAFAGDRIDTQLLVFSAS